MRKSTACAGFGLYVLSIGFLLLLPAPFRTQAQTKPALDLRAKAQEQQCSAYFGVVQYEPRVPGSYVARMTDSQAQWFTKEGRKQYPGLCQSLEKAQYLIVWTTTTRTQTSQQTVQRTAQVNTTTTGSETGTFSTYGALSTWGTYSGTSLGSSTSTVTYRESVPVSVTTDYCFVYIVKSVGSTVWEDIRNKTAEPPAIFSTETRGRSRTSGGDDSAAATGGRIVGGLLSLALRREPTQSALDAALKFILTQTAKQ